MNQKNDIHVIFVLFGKVEYLACASKILSFLNEKGVHLHVITSHKYTDPLERMQLKNLKIYVDPNIENIAPSQAMLNRYIYIQKIKCLPNSVILFRDLDADWSERDWNAIQLFFESKKQFLIIKDHPAHNINILGGLFGGVYESLLEINLHLKSKSFYDKLNTYKPKNFYGYDQHFLCSKVWPIVKNYSLILDIYRPQSCPLSKKFFRTIGYMGNKSLIDNHEEGLFPKYRKPLKTKIMQLMIDAYYRFRF